MISISTTTFNSNGTIVIYEATNSDLKELSPRMSRSATLDGGAVINHQGFSHGDRTFRVFANNVSMDISDALKTIIESETLVYLACNQGFFKGGIDNFSDDGSELFFRFLVQEKLG